MISKVLMMIVTGDFKSLMPKNVKGGQYEGQRYVSLHELVKRDDKTYNKFINFNLDEWRSFVFSLILINNLFRQTAQYTSKEGEQWHFIEDAVGSDETKRRLVPRLTPGDEVHALCIPNCKGN